MTLRQPPAHHAGLICSRCQGNILLNDDELACVQCGHIECYLDRPHPELDRPYAEPYSRDKPERTNPGPAPPAPVHFGLTPDQAEAVFADPAYVAIVDIRDRALASLDLYLTTS